ncbi:helix-turn-helix transcriptional regulator [Pseudovibrio sp. POLY-S9]|uniref:helix-turn-helix domain-containing protein n=1 Tax=Pseudovibrio sp. POLY-S9 TaxID=1576596 RepID=UPI00070A6B93|nr:helix-turn-helix transcriptional regulator [Pseudovibrio sp. POLY-S9]
MIDSRRADIIGRRIKELRQERKLTQPQMGKLFDFSVSRLSQYEWGDFTPPFDLLMHFAEFFKVNHAWIMGVPNAPKILPPAENTIMKFEALCPIIEARAMELDIWLTQETRRKAAGFLIDNFPDILETYQSNLDVIDSTIIVKGKRL